jgi:hypothetical protein
MVRALDLPGRRQVAVPGRGPLVCADAAVGFLQLLRTARGQGQDAVAGGARAFSLRADARRAERAPGARRAGRLQRVLRGSRPDRCPLQAAGLGPVRAMVHAAGIAALHHQGLGHVPQAPSVEGLKGRHPVASECGGSSLSCDAAEPWPTRGSVTVKATRAVLSRRSLGVGREGDRAQLQPGPLQEPVATGAGCAANSRGTWSRTGTKLAAHASV